MKIRHALCIAAFISSPAFADDIAKGKELYASSGCAACHGALGAGDGAAAAALDPKPRSFLTGEYKYDTDGDGVAGSETDVYNILTNGAAKYGGAITMVPYQHLSDQDRKALAKYVKSLEN